MLRILHSVSNMDRAGIETMLMNYYRHIDRSKIQFDFLCNKKKNGAYDEEIKSMGGRIFHSPGLNPVKFFKYDKYMRNLLSDNSEIVAVHSHNGELAFQSLRAAQKYGIKARICHAHNTRMELDFKRPLKMLYKTRLKKVANYYWGCGMDAAKFYFGDRIVDNNNFRIIHNAIDTNTFKYDEKRRQAVRRDMGLTGKYVIGNVGRFAKQKNHAFILEVFKAVVDECDNAVLLLIGDGKLEKKIKRKAASLGIADRTIFMGNIENVSYMYQAMDAFLLPSLFEGLPVVGVEAQCAGLKCFFSDAVTQEIAITENARFLNLKDGAAKWAGEILKAKKYFRKDMSEKIIEAGYSIDSEARRLQDYYSSIIRDAEGTMRREQREGKNVCVITRHAVGNYGSILQTYATQKLFEKIGCRCKIIDYQRNDEKGKEVWRTLLKNSPKWDRSFATRMIYRLTQEPNYLIQYKKFSSFRSQLIDMTEEYNCGSELRSNIPKADIFCVGSDQVWGPIGGDACDSTYYLDFVPKGCKCISYSASIGREKITPEIEECIKQYLPRFSSVLVREQSAVDIIKKEGINNVELVLDPTLMLDRSDWEALCEKHSRNKKYVLVYQLHDNGDFQKYAKSFAKKANMPLKRVCPSMQNLVRGGRPVLLPTPGKFVTLFRDAEYVITDSFHGTVFSIIFGKKVVCIPPSLTGTRITGLLSLLGLEGRILKSYDDYSFLEKNIDYDKVRNALDMYKRASIEKLSDAVYGQRGNV